MRVYGAYTVLTSVSCNHQLVIMTIYGSTVFNLCTYMQHTNQITKHTKHLTKDGHSGSDSVMSLQEVHSVLSGVVDCYGIVHL